MWYQVLTVGVALPRAKVAAPGVSVDSAEKPKRPPESARSWRKKALTAAPSMLTAVLKSATAVSCTHAATVYGLVVSTTGPVASAYADVPLKLAACAPTLPVTKVAPATVAVWLWPEESAAAVAARFVELPVSYECRSRLTVRPASRRLQPSTGLVCPAAPPPPPAPPAVTSPPAPLPLAPVVSLPPAPGHVGPGCAGGRAAAATAACSTCRAPPVGLGPAAWSSAIVSIPALHAESASQIESESA